MLGHDQGARSSSGMTLLVGGVEVTDRVPLVVAEPHHAPRHAVGEEMSRQPSLPSLSTEGTLVWISRP